MSNERKGVKVGSSPTFGANFSSEIEGFQKSDTIQTQKNACSGRKVKFPQVIRHRKAEATIYGRTDYYPKYRLAYRVAGQRRLRTFETYSDAKTEAERIVRELAGGSQAAALTGSQARDALIAFERLDAFRRSTGKTLTLPSIVAEALEALGKLNGVTLGEAVERFRSTLATVTRKDLGEAVEQFLEGRKRLTEAKDGKRAQLNAKYAYNVGLWLREFAGTFPNTAVSDLAQEHLDLYLQARANLSAKSRNDRRATLRMFLSWCVDRDYLPATHRLFRASAMARETVDAQEADFYRPVELRALLEATDGPMRVMIALGGLAGLRARKSCASTGRTCGASRITLKSPPGTPRPALAA